MSSDLAPYLPIGFSAPGNPQGDVVMQANSMAAKALRTLLIYHNPSRSRSMDQFLSSIIGRKKAKLTTSLDTTLADICARFSLVSETHDTHCVVRFSDTSALVMVDSPDGTLIVPEVIQDTGKDFSPWLVHAGAAFLFDTSFGADAWAQDQIPIAWWGVKKENVTDQDSQTLLNLTGVLESLYPTITAVNILYTQNINGRVDLAPTPAHVMVDTTRHHEAEAALAKGIRSALDTGSLFAGTLLGPPAKYDQIYYNIPLVNVSIDALSAHEKLAIASTMR